MDLLCAQAGSFPKIPEFIPASSLCGVPRPTILTIPSTDTAFRTQVERLLERVSPDRPDTFETRLRGLFPRAVVRARDIAGEPQAWYVYRDGGWRPDLTGPWWEEPGQPRIVAAPDGWILEATPTALGLLGLSSDNWSSRHFTDFVRPGTLDDSLSMFAIVAEGHPLTATVVLAPTSGDVIAVDVHAWREGDNLIAVFRLADDVDVTDPRPVAPDRTPATLVSLPATDAAFRGYAQLALDRMPEPTVDGLMLRLRRLYPHAQVEVEHAVDQDGVGVDRWIARRDPNADQPSERWWEDATLARVRYDAQALILEANAAAEELLGRSMVGHHWQEFVTPGSTEQVSAMLAILAEVGSAESRFRIPRSDGSLLEFDSWTEVDADGYTTVMRPRPTG